MCYMYIIDMHSLYMCVYTLYTHTHTQRDLLEWLTGCGSASPIKTVSQEKV